MASFDLAIQTVLRHEGGYVNDPADCGGATNFGICQRSYPDLDIPALHIADAEAIYKHDFWDPLRLDEIRSQEVATKILDTAVLIGKARTVKLLQRAAPQAGGGTVTIDGILGPATLASINRSAPDLLLETFRQLLATFYRQLAVDTPTDQRFLKGWLVRAGS